MTTNLKWLFKWAARTLAQFLFAFLVIFFFLQTGSINTAYFWFYTIIVTVSLTFLKWRTSEDLLHKKMLIFWIVILLISFPFALLRLTLGTNDIEPIILFFRDNGIEEARAVARGSFQSKTQLYALFIYLLLTSGYYLNKKLRGFHHVLLISALAYLLVNPLCQYIFRQFFPNPILANFKVEEHFAKPVFTKMPDIKKNMIIVYLESLEQTYENVDQTKGHYNDFRPFMADALQSTNLVQTSGSTYTIAGIVSTQCGVPLLPRGLNNGIFLRKDSGMEVKSFYKDIECLGDRLTQDGYTLSYMNGADARKYSKRSFLSQHGYSRIFDEFSVSDDERVGRDNLWGLNDEVLYENLRKEIDYLAAQPEPFVLSYLTIATHGPDAYLDTDCAKPPEGQSKMPAAIACSFDAVQTFYQYLEQKGLTKDTIFVVMSDHLARENTLSEALHEQDERRNLFFVKDAPTQAKISKMASPLDIYPTLYELLGYELENRQANMGVSILSDRQSMIQKFDGAEEMNKRFYANHALGEFLWDNPSP
jgi:phosphoglycerol transferase